MRESMFNQVADLFHDLDMGMLPISVIFPYLPIPAHWNRDRCAPSLIPTSSQALLKPRLCRRTCRLFWQLDVDYDIWLHEKCTIQSGADCRACVVQGQEGAGKDLQPHHPGATREQYQGG